MVICSYITVEKTQLTESHFKYGPSHCLEIKADKGKLDNGRNVAIDVFLLDVTKPPHHMHLGTLVRKKQYEPRESSLLLKGNASLFSSLIV